MANRKLNYVDGKMLKVQETKIPHGGYNKFFKFIQGVLEDKYMLALCAKIQATQKPVEVFRILHNVLVCQLISVMIIKIWYFMVLHCNTLKDWALNFTDLK